MLFQARVVCTKFDIFAFILNIPLARLCPTDRPIFFPRCNSRQIIVQSMVSLKVENNCGYNASRYVHKLNNELFWVFSFKHFGHFMSELFLFTFKCMYMHALVVHWTLTVVISKDWKDRSVDQSIILQHKINTGMIKKKNDH